MIGRRRGTCRGFLFGNGGMEWSGMEWNGGAAHLGVECIKRFCGGRAPRLSRRRGRSAELGTTLR